MAYDVTSWFMSQVEERAPDNLVRKFTIGSSDYSDRVTRWPRFKKRWDEIKPVNLTMELINEDRGMNFLRDDKTILTAAAQVQFGFTHPTSGDELITLFSGTTERVKYSGGSVIIDVVDKFKQLTERVIGSDDVPVSWTNSGTLPSDIVWWAITSYGGYSAIESTSNPDIDFAAFQDWAAVFSGDAVEMHANFDGQKVSEVVRKVGRHTLSAIFIKEDKITFHRYSQADANVTSLTNEHILDLDLEFDNDETVNKQYVFADYSVTSDYHQTTVFDVNTSSVNSFGLKEDKADDENVWYVGSLSAQNLAQRIIQVKSEPYDRIDVETTLVGIARLVGETISVVDSFHGIASGFRIMSQDINLDDGTVSFEADRSQYTSPFILDTSKLDSSDVLT